MESGVSKRPKTKLAVVGVGYWGKNLVRNFYELGALEMLCDAERSIEALGLTWCGITRAKPTH